MSLSQSEHSSRDNHTRFPVRLRDLEGLWGDFWLDIMTFGNTKSTFSSPVGPDGPLGPIVPVAPEGRANVLVLSICAKGMEKKLI